MAKFVDREVQNVDWIKPASALQRPAPLLIGFDECHKDVELIALGCAIGCPPKLLDFGESAAVVGVITNRANIHGVLSSTWQRSKRRSRRIRHAFRGIDEYDL